MWGCISSWDHLLLLCTASKRENTLHLFTLRLRPKATFLGFDEWLNKTKRFSAMLEPSATASKSCSYAHRPQHNNVWNFCLFWSLILNFSFICFSPFICIPVTCLCCYDLIWSGSRNTLSLSSELKLSVLLLIYSVFCGYASFIVVPLFCWILHSRLQTSCELN